MDNKTDKKNNESSNAITEHAKLEEDTNSVRSTSSEYGVQNENETQYKKSYTGSEIETVSSYVSYTPKELAKINEEFLEAFTSAFSEKDRSILQSVPEMYESLQEYYTNDRTMPNAWTSLVAEVMDEINQDSAMKLLNLDRLTHDRRKIEDIGYIFLKAVHAKHYEVANKILQDGNVNTALQEDYLYNSALEQDTETFKFILNSLEDKDFVANNSKKIFYMASRYIGDDEICYFRPELIKFITEELIKSLGIKEALKECIRNSIDFGGSHCTEHQFFSAVLSAFPKLQNKISAEEMLTKLENEENYYLNIEDSGILTLNEENTEKCLGEILMEADIENC
ncbi:hypothetical protein [Rickettsia endosymbiont of Cardiosporidium cionae]|uniref:hypothetical protein n=1 Tax=Rickettsia endosymbiont of Cardiosporidium cionae TaxID=2777155 RepID=UPI001895C747|nr:hypothetical protein [Rickettsia endosymbiont of Cardiosporidium cionae]KAF8818958.1 hypothetical protein IHI24_000192 [Rickettsia endosymbiont of Cardiosporidium cionae]